MSSTTALGNTELIKQVPRKELTKVGVATVIGTTIEWYDFFLYAFMAALVFPGLFYPAEAGVASLISLATTGVSFLFRPLGAVIGGWLGDIFGRKVMLFVTLVLMGAATALIGVLPTYDGSYHYATADGPQSLEINGYAAGLAAPILLILLRILQGLSTGGEWGGAVLMAVEHAPTKRRGIFGAFPQSGVPLGQLAASGMLALMTGVLTPFSAANPSPEFLAWGWRIPFLVSILLVVVGVIVRLTLEESPVFKVLKATSTPVKVPIAKLFKDHWLLVVLAALTFVGNNGPGYMTTGGFFQKYATNPSGPGIDVTAMSLVVVGTSLVWLVFGLFAGWLSDRIGRKKVYVIGFLVWLVVLWFVFPMMNTSSVGLTFLGIALYSIGAGMTYGQQAAAYSEWFPASIRYTAVSVAYALGAIFGGAFAPLIAQAILDGGGTVWHIDIYLAGLMVLGLVAAILIRDKTGSDLGPDGEVDAKKSFIWSK